jgi:osmotically-inducible protein OsmY
MKYVILMTSIFFGVAAFSAIDPNAGQVKPKNTVINKKDSNPTQKNASNQSGDEVDMYLVSRIRKDIMAEKELSTSAKNIKIIAINGQVLLRGPVRSREEAQTILKYARAAAGVPNVINEISVEPEKNR